MKLRAAHLLPVIAVAIALSSCKDGNIYATIQYEIPENDLSLPNDIIVFDVTKMIVSGNSSYYAAAGKIWKADESTVAWDTAHPVLSPHLDVDGLPADLCTALVASPFGSKNTLFGGFINGSGNVGLWESDNWDPLADPPKPPSFVEGVGTEVADGDIKGAQIAQLKTAYDGSNDWLVAVAAKKNTGTGNFNFAIATSLDGLNFSELTFSNRPAGDEEKSINDVLWIGAPYNALFATEGTNVYSGPLGGPMALFAAQPSVTDGEVLYGLFFYGGTIYVSSWDSTEEAECAIYSYDGAIWTRVPVPQADNGVYPPLTRFAGPLGTTNLLIVGSDGYGYYTLPTSPTVGPLTRFQTSTSELYPAAVRKFYLDGSRLFACTALAGLWRGIVDASGSIAWTQE